MPSSLKLLPRRHLPGSWLSFVEAHPVVPNAIAITGLAVIMYLLAPTVAHPSEHGGMIDSLAAVVPSEAIVNNAIALRAAYIELVPEEIRAYVREILTNPVLYFIIPFFLLLEYLFPCKASQPLVGKAFLQDAIWFVVRAPTLILVLGVFSDFLRRFYESHLGFLTIDGATAWPVALQVLAALCVSEFLNWFSHLVRHKIYTLWLFHAVHHSQKEMNVFTDDRSHVIDKLAGSLLMFIPYYMFQVPNLYAVAIIGLYISIHSRFVHLNVKINLGWLGWVFVSPQFHRVHHSAAPEHADKNFAGVLSIFDHLFGTAYASSHVYPETGIDDTRFPTEDKSRLVSLPLNWLKQMIYPFVQVFRRMILGSPDSSAIPSRTDKRANKRLHENT